MIELSPSDEQRDMIDVARRFAGERIAPVVEAAETAGGNGHVSRRDYLDLYARAAAIGLHALLIPEEYGGAGRSTLDNALVQEELGAVDIGIGASLNLTMSVPALIVAGASDDLRSEVLTAFVEADDHVLAGALNEAGVAGSELFCPDPDPSLGIRTRARRDGDDYLVTGTKAAWVSNAGVAKAYLVFARTGPDDAPAMASTSAFYVPASTPGVSTGARTELLGMRSSFHAEVLLDDVRVPAAHRLGEENRGLELMGAAGAGMAVGLAAGYVGVARRALDLAVGYAGERRSWGVPIGRHQAVALKLADAAVDVQTARLLVWDAALAVDAGDPAAAWKVAAAKTHAVDVAIANAGRAVEVFGASGVARGVGPEKLLRDAWVGYSCDFTRDVLRLQIAGELG